MCAFDALVGGSPNYNASQLELLLKGRTGSYRDSVLLNSAAAIYISGLVKNLNDGISLASKAIDEGKALDKLKRLKQLSSEGI